MKPGYAERIVAANDRYWREFVECVPWFLAPGETATVRALHPAGHWRPSTPDFDRLFRPLGDLLRAAEITDLVVQGSEHLLFSWNTGGKPCSWLCPAPSASPRVDIHPSHAVLLRSFGGIIERANEPEGTWLLNQNEVLTEREASHDGSFIRDHAWAFDDAGGIPIALPDYYSIAREANGNDTLCHRREGTIVLFAPDHAFEHVTPLPSCPEYTLYTINGANQFADWVNAIARQWITAIG